MKIWKSFSGDHSAKLRIIGTFKTVEDARKAAKLFNDLLQVKDKSKQPSRPFSDELREVCKTHNFHSFSENDPEQLELYYPISTEENKIVVETDELEIQALLKVLLDKGAKIELYSRHDYPAGK